MSLVRSWAVKGASGTAKLAAGAARRAPKLLDSKPFSGNYYRKKIEAAKAGMAKVTEKFTFGKDYALSTGGATFIIKDKDFAVDAKSQTFNMQHGEGEKVKTRGTGNLNDPYVGVKQASEYLKSLGVPRQFRKTTLESFEIGTIRLDVAGSNTYGLRFYDNLNAYAKGRFLFETFSPQVNRSNLALPPDWNKMTSIQQWQVKPGTIIIKGKAGPQLQMGNQYIGGVEQWYITNLDSLIKPYTL
ncbi:hypothetical protein [Clostridium sp. 1xD42-85]|uniref:hypothetical protein n=1 Tax=Clostridium sp. 1xD42-85 TaxID=2320084 RepID=UPI001A9B3343|nr:hypothetical protein [Clostridium sp. 1xD42-85]